MTIEYTYEQLLAMAENIVATSANGDGHPPGADDGLEMLLDWPTFWSAERTEHEWLAHPILAAHRSHAMFAPGGTGKSLLALWLAAALATGRPIFGHHQEPRHVLYLDYEMTEDDLEERLSDMGYGPEDDMSHLHYALLPSLPGLDKPEGGKAVVQLAALCSAELVVIDTFGRAVHGDENEADTVRAWYRWTGIHLKAAGRAFLRVDHAGKDIDKGQRGTSAKNDDVDVVWKLTRRDGDVIKLTAKKKRMQWVPDAVELELGKTDGFEYRTLTDHQRGWPAGTKTVAAELGELGVPVETAQKAAAAMYRASGRKVRQDVIVAAVKYRKQAGTTTGTTISASEPILTVVPPVPKCESPAQDIGTAAGTNGYHERGTVPVPPASIEAVPGADPERPNEEDVF